MKEINLNLERQIAKEDEKKYLFLPFDIPENTEYFTIDVSFEGEGAGSNVTDEEKNVIDFALMDENGDDVGASGSNTRSITVGLAYSSPGYRRCKPRGTWQIIIGCYQVKATGSKVSYNVNFKLKHFRYLLGDLHTHTRGSDGVLTPEELAAKAVKKGLDFVFITDHNNSTQDTPIPKVKDLTVVEGLELTNYKGHINLLGHEKPYDGTYAVNNIDELNQKLDQAKSRGAMRVLNHPFCFMCPILWDFDQIDYDAIEIWNGPAVRKDMLALDWWQKELEKGKQIPVTGGSDYHRDYYVTDLLASPTTRVWADSNDKETLLEAIKKGKMVITKGPDTTMLDIRCGQYTVGDKIALDEDKALTISAKGMKKGHVLQVFTQEGLVFEYENKKTGDYEYSMTVRNKGFVRAQIVYEKGFFAKLLHKLVLSTLSKEEAKKDIPPLVYALTNPIYFY
ncbi:MAG: CehA/McbA family metallohydrolase [Clostridiales bacterium]|nr:CehA/McbA family metallohydrolase [Clostridiales bacterium]